MTQPGYQYRNDFFDFVDRSSGRSAGAFLAALAHALRPASVLDVGCGRGVWLAAWAKTGVTDLQGVDGDYVDRTRLQIPAEKFCAADLTRPLDLGRKFDLVECLEVAEHLPEAAAGQLIDNLARHGDKILFSAATPGQGGEHHVNEQPLGYWVERLRRRDYRVFDWPRQQVAGRNEIEPWYRYNSLLFVHSRAVADLPPEILASEIMPGAPIPTRAPLLWRLRCALLGCLPAAAIHQLAQIKHRFSTRSSGHTP